MKNCLIRALKTFIQAAFGYIAANLAADSFAGGDTDAVKTAVMTLAVSAVAAGLAAVMNLPGKHTEGK